MSYWVYLKKEAKEGAELLPVPRFSEGGICTLGGTGVAELNITYNYSEVYAMFNFSIKDLHLNRACESIPKLMDLVNKLGTKKYKPNYWAPTPGNAGYALSILLQWAELHPDGYFWVS